MKIEDLAFVMGKTTEEVKEMLKSSDVVELQLKETRQREAKDIGEIELIQ